MGKQPAVLDAGFLLPDIEHSIQAFPHLLPKIGLLRPTAIRAVMDSYLFAQQYYGKVLLIGGQDQSTVPQNRRMAYLDHGKSSIIAELNQLTADFIDRGIKALEEEIKGNPPRLR
jgi:hypothetical protein